MLGSRDSEIALVLTDEQFVPSNMNGQPYSAGKFSCSLRRRLMKEHLGIINENPQQISIRDPVVDSFYKDVWLKTAQNNTIIYEKVFSIIPTDQVRYFGQLKEYLSKTKLSQIDYEESKRMLNNINGHLVLTPLNFLCEENLKPSAGTKESLMLNSIWT